MVNYKHYCPEYDFLEIDADSPEYENCICQIDSNGRGPEYHKGDRVLVKPNKLQATVIRQILTYDYPESFWGNVELLYDDGVTGVSNNWQLKKL